MILQDTHAVLQVDYPCCFNVGVRTVATISDRISIASQASLLPLGLP
jgi:hypothetical protein